MDVLAWCKHGKMNFTALDGTRCLKEEENEEENEEEEQGGCANTLVSQYTKMCPARR